MSSFGTVIQFVPATPQDVQDTRKIAAHDQGKYLDFDKKVFVMFPNDGSKPYLIPAD